jgi:prolyl-tRNA synthetase
MSSNVTIVGNLTRDPELRFTPAGAPVTTFGVAVNRRWQNRDNQQWEESVSFFNVTCWRDLAQNVSESLEKGSRVVVTGRLEQRSWETNDGERRSVVEIVADEALREGQYVVGANRDGWHLRGVQAGRDYEPRFGDLRQARESDTCPNCGGALRFQTAIEVGHIFKLGTFYSIPLGATFLDEDGKEKPLIMGSYGVGVTRTMAAVVEQRHDEHGITWPAGLAPYEVHVIALAGLEEQSEEVAEALEHGGRSVLLDDRDQRPGEKFADADLIGCPTRVTVGKRTLEDGGVDIRDRTTGEERRVTVAEVENQVGIHG